MTCGTIKLETVFSVNANFFIVKLVKEILKDPLGEHRIKEGISAKVSVLNMTVRRR